MQPDDPVDQAAADPGAEAPAPDEPDLDPPEVAERAQPRLAKPRAFREAQERLRREREWNALEPSGQESRLRAMYEHAQDARYQKARRALLGLLDDGRLAVFLTDVARYMSRRGLQTLKRQVGAGGKDGRRAMYFFNECLRLLVRLKEAERVGGNPEDPDWQPPPQRPKVRVSAGHDGDGKPAARGVLRVRTRFALDGEKT